MPTTRARRTFPVAPAVLWPLVGDPRRLPRWWPRAVRVEGVGAGGFTLVMTSARGREVRADQRVTVSDRPRRRAWALDVAGTPFASVFAASETEVRLRPVEDGAATEVTLTLDQRVVGGARLGSLMVRRAARRQLREALDGLGAAIAEA